MNFKFELDGIGWAVVSLQSGDDRMAMSDVSYLSDALGNLVQAVSDLLTEGSGSCVWDHEPGSTKWEISRVGTTARVLIFTVDEDAVSPDQYRRGLFTAIDGHVIFDGTCEAIELGTAVLDAAIQLRETYTSRFRHPFPDRQVDLLADAIRRGIAT